MINAANYRAFILKSVEVGAVEKEAINHMLPAADNDEKVLTALKNHLAKLNAQENALNEISQIEQNLSSNNPAKFIKEVDHGN